MRPTLLLFDIDGTLLLTGRAGLRAMVGAFEALFGVPDAFAGVSMGGRTDSWLVSDALARWGLADTPDNHARFRAAYLPRLAEEILLPGTGVKGVMPGVRELARCRRAPHPHLHLALLTGNYREAAAIKLRYFASGTTSPSARSRTMRPIATCWCRSRGSGQRHTASPKRLARASSSSATRRTISPCAAVSGRALDRAWRPAATRATSSTRAGADVALDDLSDTEASVLVAAGSDVGGL